MKRKMNDFELLSAYLDGELSREEIIYIENKLKFSAELQERLKEYQALKSHTAQAFGVPGESPYLETRILAGLSGEKAPVKKLRRWVPAAGFAVLAAALMIMLKINPRLIDDFVEQQQVNIAGFYKENLKPLLFAADLSNEDVFNFAFYNQLPLDRQDSQYLSLGYDEQGQGFFEIKTEGSAVPEGNFESFVKALKLDEKQKLQMDSILDTYAEELQTQVLVNEKNTVAISPKLWDYNKAIAADLMAFAQKANKAEFMKIVPAAAQIYRAPEAANMVKMASAGRDNKYIFFTPDTIFIDDFQVDKAEFKREMNKMKEELILAEKELRNNKLDIEIRLGGSREKLKRLHKRGDNFIVSFDSNITRVELPARIEMPKITMVNLDSLGKIIDEAANSVKVYTYSRAPRDPKTRVSYGYKYQTGDSAHSYHYEVRIPNIDSIMRLNMMIADSLLKFNNIYRFKSDSLQGSFKFKFDDSSAVIFPRELKKEMENFQKEMEQFRKEMMDIKKDIKRDTVKTRTRAKTYIEI